MRTVHEVSHLSGVSVRTLHHYDAIGLLKPTQTTDAGYRLYDDTALARLQTILLFRELQFPLKDIARIIDNPGFDRDEALQQQIRLLELRREQLGKLISFARQIKSTGVNNMDFSAFDNSDAEKYEAEVKQRWGGTAAYGEYKEKSKNRTSEQQKELGALMINIFAEMGKIKTLSPDSAQAQAKVGELRQFITDNYYNCTLRILGGLGQMYSAGGSMTDNIDKAGGVGTAEFASKAIEIYCAVQSD